MGCDYVDMDHHARMERRRRHFETLERLGFDRYSVRSGHRDDDTIASCKLCGASVWVGDLTRTERMPLVWAHVGWHQSLGQDTTDLSVVASGGTGDEDG